MKRFLTSLALAVATFASAAGPITTEISLTRGAYEYTPTVAGNVAVGGVQIFGPIWIGADRFNGINIGAMKGFLPDVDEPNFPGPSFLMFCADLYNGAARIGTAVNYDKIDYVNGTSPYDKIGKIFTANGGLASTDASSSAAMQLAIWNVLYDNDADVKNGTFRIGIGGTTGSHVADKANSLLAAANSLTSSQWDVSLLSDNGKPYNGKKGYQDFVTGTFNPGNSCGIGNDVCNAVPEPDALALMGGGLVALAFVQRRRRVQK